MDRLFGDTPAGRAVLQLGQGANMALIDAHELAAELPAGPAEADWPQVFARYSRRRRAHLRFYGQASRGLTPMFQSL